MKPYRIEIERRAEREFEGLPANVLRRVSDVLDALEDNPRPPGAKKLTGREGYRIRTGVYRILYTIDDSQKTIRVYRIGHRREVYRRG